MGYTYAEIAKLIDHSLLQPMLTEAELGAGCQVAREYAVASVCVLPYFLKRAAALLAGSTIFPTTTIGFPHGAHTSAVKLTEAERALNDGAVELDMVVNISQVRSGRWDYVQNDIGGIVTLAHAAKARVKVIFENCYLDDAQKIRLCRLCGELGADWVKTSTGYAPGGANLADVKLMREHSPAAVQVKAAGGIRDLDTLLEYRALGVTRVGASRTVEMLEECRRRVG
jgi:deoxyribose-phosphate aldolase